MWTHTKPLPDWAFKTAEINGNKNALDKTATWFIDQIVSGEGGHLASHLHCDYAKQC